MLASYAALDLAGRVTAARGRAQGLWLVGGATAMGVGIWSMHYIGMLAFTLPIQVLYEIRTVVVSWLAAVLASGVALWVVSRRQMGVRRAAFGSVAMGLGISTMHYTGMAAMRLSARVSYDSVLVTLSILIAIVVSFVALYLSFHLRTASASRWHWHWRRVASAVVMGAAIPSMHYTGMAAARFTPATSATSAQHAIDISSLGTAGIALTTFMVLALAILTSLIDRRFSAQRERADKALRTQERFLRQIIDANPHLIFVKDWSGTFALANAATAAIYGTTPEGLLGKRDADFNANAEEVEHFLRDDREVMTSLATKHIAEEPVTHSITGETRWFQTVKVPLISEDGTARQVLGVATDITPRKLLEDQLRQAQKMEAVGQLAGGVAHDFNNLLTAIIGYADILAEKLAGVDSGRTELLEIQRAAERAAELTRQLLAFSRRQVLKPKRLDLDEVVANMGQLLRRLIGEDIELRTIRGKGLGKVYADPGQIEQVILNLAVNARDAMPLGGRLTIETANVELDEAYSREHLSVQPGPHVLLAVSDTGIGMDAKTKAHLFEPFFTTKGPGKGTGLGLATVYGIVQQSYGHIWVYSEPGQGTTFKIYFPRVEAVAEGAASALEPSAVEGGTETILLAEDEDRVRALIQRVLERHGYTVLAAANGDEALRLAQEHNGSIHLLATDVVMPKMSGRELARRLAPVRPETRVLYLSGYTDDAIVHHILEPGIEFLQKPFTPAGLARKIRDVLSAN